MVLMARWWRRRAPAPAAQPLPPVTLFVGEEPVTVDMSFGTTTLAALGPVFRVDQLGSPVTGTGVPAGTRLVAVSTPRVAMMSQAYTLNRDDMVEALAELAEAMKPVIELAEGQRKMLEAQGWSPTAAEAYALELLLGLTRHAVKGGKP